MRAGHSLEYQSIRDWVDQVRARDAFSCSPASLASSNAWALQDGRVRHASGRFFSVIGLRWIERGMERYQPFLDQQEVGTLGFVLRERCGVRELLCHAKVEPGNVGVVQLAPTCQATRSNLDRVHGGALPPYADEFLHNDPLVVSDSLQSEQGSRFYRKRNRNVVVRDDAAQLCDEQHRWLPVDVFAKLLAEDYLVNTDARSVLITSDWASLFNRPLFQGQDPFSRALRASHAAACSPRRLQLAVERVQSAREVPMQTAICPVDAMPGWMFDQDTARTVSGTGCGIEHIRTHCGTREVSDWDQPMFTTEAELAQTLLCCSIDGQLCFGFRCLPEPGLLNVAELAPSIQGELPPRYRDGRVQAAVRQSDEGGRFLHDVTLYSIVEITSAEPDPELVWLSLAELQELLPQGFFNNEARSVLSLLLAFA